jgi:predicted nuclease of predicted toxin-antitoxin system
VLLLVDECFPKSLVLALRHLGHNVTWASIVCQSEPDIGVLALATAQGRLVVTEDRDFGTLVVRDGLPTAGIVIVHGSDFVGGILECATDIAQLINQLADGLPGKLTTISPGRVRQRPLGETL